MALWQQAPLVEAPTPAKTGGGPAWASAPLVGKAELDNQDSEFWKGFGGYLLKQGPEAVASTVQAGGVLLGNDWLETSLAPRIRKLAEEDETRYTPRVGALENIRWDQITTNPGAVVDDVADYAMYTLGNGLASTLPSIVGGLGGAAVGGAAGSAVPVIGTGLGATAGAITGATATSYIQNTGPLFDELVAEGMAPKDAAVWAAGGGVVLAGLDAFYPAKAALGLAKGTQQEIRRALVKRILQEAGKGALQEGATEAAQEAVQTGLVAAGTGKDVDWRDTSLRLANAFAGGAMAGGTIGGATGIRPDAQPKPTQQAAPGAAAPAGAPSPAAPPPVAPTPSPIAPEAAGDPLAVDPAVMPETGDDLAAEAQDVAYLTDLATKGGAPGPGVPVTLLDPEDGGEIVTGTVEAYVGAPDDIQIRVVNDRGQAVELPVRSVRLRRNDLQQPAAPDVSRETDEPVTVRPAAPAPGAPIPAPPATEAPAAAMPASPPGRTLTQQADEIEKLAEQPEHAGIADYLRQQAQVKRQQAASDDLEAARAEVNTEPTDAQKEAGNYKKGHVRLHGLDIAIENPKGSERRGKDAGGQEWSVTMPVDYGYVKRTEGADGDQVDVFLGPEIESERVYAISQKDLDTGKFDEFKIMLGFPSPIMARRAYVESFSDGRGIDRIERITPYTMDEFKANLKAGTFKSAAAHEAAIDAMSKPASSEGENRQRPSDQPAAPQEEGQPPEWFTELTREGRRQLALDVGLSKGQAAAIGAMNWPNLSRMPEIVARMEAKAKATPEPSEPAAAAQVTEPADDATIPGKEGSDDGVQGPVPAGDAPEGAGDVQRAPQEREPGRAPAGEKRRSAPDAERPAGKRAEAAERKPKESGRPDAGGRDSAGDADRVPERKPRAERSPDLAKVKGENFRIEAGALKEGRGWKQKALDNIRAIELMREIEAEGRPATREEQEQLALYVGWGGIRGAFPDTNGEFAKGFEDIGKKLKDLLSETEYATARRSIQYAHYTSETIVRAMWSAAERLGFKGGKVFEPGMGVGNFAGMMPADLTEATMYNGLELDHTTARIARLLYPKWGIRQDDFTKAPLPHDTYDMVIGNPPFADIPIKSDPAYAKHSFLLHDYFFAKSLDAVRPGGLLMFISSAGTMNKIDTKARNYMADRADLVGAIRLPGDAFEKNAGTAVTTDIIVLRKRLPNEPAGDRSWVETGEQTLPTKDGGEKPGAVSRYFLDHPEMVLGEPGFFDRLLPNRYAVRSDGRSLPSALAKAMESLPENILSERQTPAERAEEDFGTAERKDGSFYIAKDGALMQVQGGVGRAVQRRGKGVAGGKTAAEIERIEGLVPIRDALRAVYDADLAQDSENADKARKRLNKAYDAFVKKFGPINKAQISYRRPTVIQQETARDEAREEARFNGQPFDEGSFDDVTRLLAAGASRVEIARARRIAKEAAAAAGRPWSEGTFDPDDMPDTVIDKRPNIEPFMDDPESYRLRAIERYNDQTGEAQKSAVFFENVITRERAPEISSVGDALLFVLNRIGRVDLGQIAAAAKVSESEAVEQLAEAIFKEPGTNVWQTREQYLSGNVRQKLRQAKAAAGRNAEFARNVAALEAVQPAPLPPSEISANLGMPWIPPKVIEQFGKELGLEFLTVSYQPKLAQWTVGGDKSSAASRSTWGTTDRSAPDLISDALNRTVPKIYDRVREDGRDKMVLNTEATQAAQDKLAEIKEKFRDWLWDDAGRAAEMAALYNEEYNNLVVPEYDGSYLTTPGIAARWSWRPHQKRVIARIIQSGNTYLAHAVGAGKTSEMIGAAMEMRRLGLVKKPMFTVPNHMLGQFTKEFYEQYPTARIAVADERRFHTDRRKQFIADVANDDLDAIIITHSAFGLIPVSDQFQDGLIQQEISDYRDVLSEIDKKDPEQRFTRRRIENAVEKLEQRLSGKQGRKDQVFTFEEMGVDFLFVDEAHLFRKLDFATKMTSVKGISPEGSKASFDLYVKTRYLQTINPGRNLVLASGTPVTNTMAELFTVSRYLQQGELDARGLGQFDAWAGAFGDTVTQLEQNPAGGYQPVTRFAKFVNVPELSAMIRQVMDVVTSRQLDQYVTRPKLKGGKRQMNLAERGDALEDYQADLARRMEAIAKRKGPPKPGDDIILSVINDGRHAAIDMRLVDPALPNDPGSKLNLLVDNVFRIWKETRRKPFHAPEPEGFSKKPVDHGPAAQMIFANLGLNDARGFSVPRYIVSELKRRGVPEDEIALIANYKEHVAKQRLFNDMNEGKKRILIGSTAKMATGVNAQRRLYALHNLDPLWYPADDEQRNGRIIRQGNMNPEVEIHDYSTKGTYDSTMWGLMETKARFIQGFFEGDPSIRDMDDLGEASQYEQAKAITTADPRLIELTELKQKLERAQRRKTAFDREMYAIQDFIGRAKGAIAHADKRIPDIEADIAKREDISGDKFKMKVGKKTYSDRVEAGEALLGEIDLMVQEHRQREDVIVGDIAGFPIIVDVRQYKWLDDKPWVAEMVIARAGGHETEIKVMKSARGMISKLEDALDTFEGNLAHYRDEKTAKEKAIKDYTPQLDKKFEGQAEIDELRAQVRKLEGQLAAEAQKAEPQAVAAEVVEETMEEAPADLDDEVRYAVAQQPRVNLRKPGPVIRTIVTELRRMVPAAKVALVPELFATSAGAAEASGGQQGDPVAGAYGNGLIAMAYETIEGSSIEPEAWARHEAIHALKDLGFFNEREIALLEAESRKRWISEHGLPNRPDDSRVVEEGIAYAFQSWQPGERSVAGPIARIFRKMRTFFERLVNALKGLGFQTVEDVFERVYSGEVGQRRLADVAGSRELVTEALDVAEKDLREIATAYARPGETVSTGPDGRTNRFDQDIERWRKEVGRLRRGDNRPLSLGRQNFVLRVMGAPKDNVTLDATTAKAIDQKHRDLPANVWQNLPDLMADPLIVFPFRDNLNVVLDAKTAKGEPIVVGVREGTVRTITPYHTTEEGTGQGRIERQLTGALASGRKIYVRDGKVPSEVLQALRHQNLPARGQSASGGGSHPRAGTKKNILSRDDVIKDQGRVFYAMADVGQKARQTVENLKGNLPLAPNVGVEAPEIERDLNPLKRPFYIPASLFKDWPALGAAVDRWSRRQAALQSSLTRVQREWDQATRKLSAGEMETLTAILFRGDALGEAYSAEDLTNLVDENGDAIEISDQVAKAYQDSRKILDKLGNLVDQHERAMRNFLRRRIKPTLIRSIARNSPLSAAEASTLLTKRYALRSRLHTGNGDPETLAARIEKIEKQLGYERGAEDPVSQAIEQLDIVDRTLNRTSIKRRDADGNVIEGYVPHKFFGSWAVYRVVEDTDADGETFERRELVADYAEHGFHASRTDAITAANRYAGENPDEQLVVRPVAMRFAGSSAATLPGPQYQSLIARVSDGLEVPAEELRETLKDTIRPRSKRRWAGFKQKRLGIEGYSRDLDRVLRAHIGEVMRYVYLDKVKYEAITLEESMRLEEGSRRRPQLGAAWRAYVRDVLSERQPLEKVLDSLFDKPWLQPLHVGLGGGIATFALAGGISGNPFVGLLLGSWVGYRFYQARRSAGEMGGFYSRGLTGELLNTTAHLKLGAVFNLFSALVNITQIALNTASVLPYRYVAYGMGEAMLTVSGASKKWVRMLDRHNIDPVFKHSEVSPHIYDKPSRLAQLSMIAFDTVEKVNRSATFIGAYKQALDGNAKGVPADNPGAAQRYAMRVVNRTQFDYSNAMKPEALRNVFLRVPLQFKNFVAQQIAFVAGLQNKAEVGKFLLHMFLLTGLLGLPGLQLLDWLTEWLAGVSPINEIKRIALSMQAEGAFVGTMVDGLARGFPALFGVDISSRAGMGERFLPSLQVSDLIGPMPSTIVKARELAEHEAGMVDQLRNLSTGLGGPLKALESAANGMPITTLFTEPGAFLGALGDEKAVVTNPRKKLRAEAAGTELSSLQLAMMGVGGSPIEMTRIYDFAQVARFEDERLDRLSNRYMNRIAQAYRTWMPHNPDRFREEMSKLRVDARDEDGLLISTQAIRRLMKDMQRDRVTRTIFQYRKQQRPELIRLSEGLRT